MNFLVHPISFNILSKVNLSFGKDNILCFSSKVKVLVSFSFKLTYNLKFPKSLSKLYISVTGDLL